MAIKSASSDKSETVKKFPKLMINEMYIMLFGTAGVGTVVHVVTSLGTAWSVGHQALGIPMGGYEDYTGTVRLTNK